MLRRIVVVNDFAYVNGGAAQVALRSAVALAQRGHSVVVFCAVAPVMRELEHANISVVCSNQRDILSDPLRVRAALQGMWNIAAARRMEGLLSSCDPSCTVVHVHSWSKALSTSVVDQAVKLGFPTVVTLHDYFSACPNGGFYNYQKKQICHLVPLSARCIAAHCDARSYSHKLWRVGRQLVQRYCGGIPGSIRNFVTVSEFSESILRPYLPPDARIYRIENPLVAAKDESVDVAHNTAFLFVGRLSPEKGPVLFARAGKKAGVEMTFVGDGPCRSEIMVAYPSARITGWLASEDVQPHLRRARAVVFPSHWYETHGLVVSEAAALGIPAIVPDTCAARDFVVDGVTGLWFKGGNEDDLVAKMQMFEDPRVAAEMGKNAYDKFWSSPATLEQHVSKLEECYAEVMRDAERYMAL